MSVVVDGTQNGHILLNYAKYGVSLYIFIVNSKYLFYCLDWRLIKYGTSNQCVFRIMNKIVDFDEIDIEYRKCKHTLMQNQ